MFLCVPTPYLYMYVHNLCLFFSVFSSNHHFFFLLMLLLSLALLYLLLLLFGGRYHPFSKTKYEAANSKVFS